MIPGVRAASLPLNVTSFYVRPVAGQELSYRVGRE